tara:strand:+ start:563 stop:823 length:261 start_codon:yes stop_codon:yes gene_type:complete
MRAVVKMADHTVILDMEQLAALMTIMRSAERLDEEHMGKGKGTHGYEMSYLKTVLPPLTDLIRCEMMDDVTYESIKAIAAIRKANI